MTDDLFGSEHPFKGCYQDDGIYVTNGNWTVTDLCTWLELFQSKVKTIAESEHIHFTGVLWDPSFKAGDPTPNKDGIVDMGQGISVATRAGFPFLNMLLSWNTMGKLDFAVYRKPNQRLKYVPASSMHT